MVREASCKTRVRLGSRSEDDMSLALHALPFSVPVRRAGNSRARPPVNPAQFSTNGPE